MKSIFYAHFSAMLPSVLHLAAESAEDASLALADGLGLHAQVGGDVGGRVAVDG